MSVAQLTGEVSKLHPKTVNKEPGVAKEFPSIITKTFPSLTFTEEDRESIVEIFRILTATAGRLPGAPKKKEPGEAERAAMLKAHEDVLGRVLPELALAHVKKFPGLAILYRHALRWDSPEGGQKTGKANGFLAYAYLIFLSWRVYGDTIGKMFALEDYVNLRKGLFAFLGTVCAPNLDDYFGAADAHPAIAQFANWDHKLTGHFVNLKGVRLLQADTKQKGKGKKTATPTQVVYASSTAKAPQASAMATHVTNAKKFVDSIIRHPLARATPTAGVSPEVATLARQLTRVYFALSL